MSVTKAQRQAIQSATMNPESRPATCSWWLEAQTDRETWQARALAEFLRMRNSKEATHVRPMVVE